MQTAFDILVDPRRREIIEQLRRQPRSTGELAAHLGLSQPGTSKHLRQLRDAGFVTVRPRAQQRIYSLAPAPFDELDAWLQGYRRAWARGLDELGDYLDATDAAAPDPRAGAIGSADEAKAAQAAQAAQAADASHKAKAAKNDPKRPKKPKSTKHSKASPAKAAKSSKSRKAGKA